MFSISSIPITRHRIPASTWLERVAHWRSTGLSIHAFCRDREIGVERIRYRACRVERAAASLGLLPVRISALSTTAPLALRSPSGWSMRMDTGIDAA